MVGGFETRMVSLRRIGSSTSRTDVQEFIKMIAARYAQISGADSSCPTSGNGQAVTTLLELAKAAGAAQGV